VSIPLDNTERWEETHFARLRAAKAAGERTTWILLRPSVFALAGLGIGLLLDNVFLSGLVACFTFYQILLIDRLLTYQKRLDQPGAGLVTEHDPRPPVLLLRSFSLDELPVNAIDVRLNGFMNLLSWADKRTFEEALMEKFGTLGPLVAIGRPGEDVAPRGASREYVSNAEWQERVLDRARSAQLIIMVVDATPGMAWEIENVPKVAGLGRILFVLPPVSEDSGGKEPPWRQRWDAMRERFAFLPELSEDTIALLFDDADQPVAVTAPGKPLGKQLDAVKLAWLDRRQEQD
jgi:hypothetical protein